ncbi:hypothetical protein MKK75_01370 [Methylobacterium sp. J-030]|uniref:hypothetical protein n=1 Tax=Methylobacterium sp. J-030 TaxID=2836627 RepID=UPI001FBB277A|nr:hypothetical protein [Methylobacterium sp. J-030]MCJ2067467.1 hypothetical protein [Methylobacterium sp. J-030]
MTQNLQQQQMQPTMDGRPMPERIGALEVRVGGIETGIQHIVTKLDNRDKVPWLAIIGSAFGAITLIVTLISGIGALAFSPLSSGLVDLKAALVKMESATQRYVPREDLDTRFNVVTQRRDDLQRLTDNRIERVERDVDAVAKQVVPREEHRIVRELQQKDYDLLRNRIERVEARFEKRSDVLDRHVEKLEDRTISRSEALTRNDAQDRVTGMLRGEVDEHVRAFNERQQRRIDALESGPRR